MYGKIIFFFPEEKLINIKTILNLKKLSVRIEI